MVDLLSVIIQLLKKFIILESKRTKKQTRTLNNKLQKLTVLLKIQAKKQNKLRFLLMQLANQKHKIKHKNKTRMHLPKHQRSRTNNNHNKKQRLSKTKILRRNKNSNKKNSLNKLNNKQKINNNNLNNRILWRVTLRHPKNKKKLNRIQSKPKIQWKLKNPQKILWIFWARNHLNQKKKQFQRPCNNSLNPKQKNVREQSLSCKLRTNPPQEQWSQECPRPHRWNQWCLRNQVTWISSPIWTTTLCTSWDPFHPSNWNTSST